MKNVLEKGRVTAGQDVLVKLQHQLKMLGTPPLGPEFAKLTGAYLNDSLVVHRFTSKFEVPIDGGEDSRKRASIQKMLDYDNTYPEIRKNFFKGHGVVSHHLKAKAWLHTCMKGYKASNSIEFPSGESVNSAQAEVDMYYKLIREDQWTVSQSCVRAAAKLAYNCRALKRVVIDRYKARYTGLLDRRKLWVSEAIDAGKYIGYYVFERMFLYTVSIVGVSRLTTVPKNNSEDRVISCEPTWNVIVQRSIALGILECIRKHTGVDVQQLQSVHRAIIADRNLATIDLSKASDSNWLNLFTMFFPKRIVEEVLAARCGIVEYDGEYFPLNQLAPMGCGYTFEIMTATLMAYARVVSPYATVFGDDIIVDKRAAPRLIKTLEAVGWKINVNKSFVEGNFSESCGGYYNHITNNHMLSYDLSYPKTISDVLVATNKISNLLRFGCLGDHLRRILLVAYVELLKIIPSVAYTWCNINDGEEGSMVYVPRTIPLDSFQRSTDEELKRDLQRGVSYGKRVTFSSDVQHKIRDVISGSVWYACYMYHGRKTIGARRGELRWESYMRAL